MICGFEKKLTLQDSCFTLEDISSTLPLPFSAIRLAKSAGKHVTASYGNSIANLESHIKICEVRCGARREKKIVFEIRAEP